tara:strand:- start:8104 stop:9357 length:1254 start_codon:yes stop_codon:yes gene_type:complete
MVLGAFALAVVLQAAPALLSGDPARVSLEAAEVRLADQPGAVEQVWAELTGEGVPRIETIAGDSEHRRVTFLYKSAAAVSEVRLNSVINAPRVRMPVEDFIADYTLPLQRLAGSPIWALSLDVPRDVQASYSFMVTGPNGMERLSDPRNRVRLRGGAAEAVLVMDRVEDLSPLAPVDPASLPAPAVRQLDSAALERSVTVEIHPGAGAGPDAPVLILYDAFNWGVRAPAWEIVHNLAAAGQIPPMHVVLIDQLDEASELDRYDGQTRFVVDELLPWLRAEYGYRLDRGNVVLGGASRRGLAAVIIALARPEAVGAAISLSGSFYWAPQAEDPEWLARQLGAPGDTLPQFQLAAGSLEYIETSTNTGHVMLHANENMAAALAAAGYPVRYSVYPGGHDIAAWRMALANRLRDLFARAD